MWPWVVITSTFYSSWPSLRLLAPATTATSTGGTCLTRRWKNASSSPTKRCWGSSRRGCDWLKSTILAPHAKKWNELKGLANLEYKWKVSQAQFCLSYFFLPDSSLNSFFALLLTSLPFPWHDSISCASYSPPPLLLAGVSTEDLLRIFCNAYNAILLASPLRRTIRERAWCALGLYYRAGESCCLGDHFKVTISKSRIIDLSK